MARTEVAVKKDSTELAVPDFMKDQAGLGTESLGSSDVEIPRIKLLQALSPELQEHNSAKAGTFWHSLAEKNLGTSVRVTPIYVDQRFILWRPRKSGGGILARADDGIHWSPPNVEFSVRLDSGQEVKWRTAVTVEKSGLDLWGSSNTSDPGSPPAATRMYNMVITFPDDPDMPPAVVTMQRATIKVARRFIGKMKITRAPSFGLIFEMRSIEDSNGAGQKFFNYAFKGDGMVMDKGVYENNFKLYQFFKAQGISVKDLESAQEDDIPNEGTPDKDKPAF